MLRPLASVGLVILHVLFSVLRLTCLKLCSGLNESRSSQWDYRSGAIHHRKWFCLSLNEFNGLQRFLNTRWFNHCVGKIDYCIFIKNNIVEGYSTRRPMWLSWLSVGTWSGQCVCSFSPSWTSAALSLRMVHVRGQWSSWTPVLSTARWLTGGSESCLSAQRSSH